MEKQLVEAKLKESTMILAEEREQNLIEKQKLLSDNVEMRQRCETLMVQLEASKTKDKMYAEKFDEFETTLSKSNEMFNTFKSEMDKVCYWVFNCSWTKFIAIMVNVLVFCMQILLDRFWSFLEHSLTSQVTFSRVLI